MLRRPRPATVVLAARRTRQGARRTGLGLQTVGDLLRHYPRRYAERGELTDLASLRGRRARHRSWPRSRTVQHQRRCSNRRGLPSSRWRRHRRPRPADADLLRTRRWRRARASRVGRRGLFAGQGRRRSGATGSSPTPTTCCSATRRRRGEDDRAADALAVARRALIPVYPADQEPADLEDRQGASGWCSTRSASVPDPLPDGAARAARPRRRWPRRSRWIHRPDVRADDVRAARRPARASTRRSSCRSCWPSAGRAAAALPAGAARRRAPAALLDAFDAAAAVRADRRPARGRRARSPHDLARAHPMHRLLQGEVGSRQDRRRAAGDARAWSTPAARPRCSRPTEVLAQQHHRSITALLGPLAERGMLGGADRRHPGRAAHRLAAARPRRRRRCSTSPAARPASSIGTHALLEEQRRTSPTSAWSSSTSSTASASSSATRCAAKARRRPPHVLVMTATPIPRTVAMTVFGDLEISTLDRAARPAGRRSPRTWCRRRRSRTSWTGPGSGSARRSPRATRRTSCARGSAATTPSEAEDDRRRATTADEADDVEPAHRGGRRWRSLDVAPELAEGPLAGLRVGVLHGRLPADEKDDVMRRFAGRATVDVLVATTVIEVGVDVAERHRDGRHGRRPVRRLPAAPAARPGRPRRAARAVPAGHRAPSRDARRGSGSTRSPRPPTGSSCPGSTSSSAARATCSARRQSGRRSSRCGCSRCCATRT